MQQCSTRAICGPQSLRLPPPKPKAGGLLPLRETAAYFAIEPELLADWTERGLIREFVKGCGMYDPILVAGVIRAAA